MTLKEIDEMDLHFYWELLDDDLPEEKVYQYADELHFM